MNWNCLKRSAISRLNRGGAIFELDLLFEIRYFNFENNEVAGMD